MGDHARSPGAVVFYFIFSKQLIQSFPPPPPFYKFFSFFHSRIFPTDRTLLALFLLCLLFTCSSHHTLYIIISKTVMPMRRTADFLIEIKIHRKESQAPEGNNNDDEKRCPFLHAGQTSKNFTLQHVLERMYLG